MDSKQELALQISKRAVQDWRDEEKEAADGVALARYGAIVALKDAVKAGVSQSAIAEACGWPRQRVHQLLNETR